MCVYLHIFNNQLSYIFFLSLGKKHSTYNLLGLNSTNVETLWRTEINYGNQEDKKFSNLSTKEYNSVSLRKPNGKLF